MYCELHVLQPHSIAMHFFLHSCYLFLDGDRLSRTFRAKPS
jgi:hypothetical protein